MKLLAYFSAFLKDAVNLNQTRLNQLDDRVAAIVSALRADQQIGELYQDHVPQGSWAHRTIIKPFNGHEFDADFLLHLQEVDGWSPQEYLREVRAAFKRSSTYKTMVTKKNRCCRIVYAGDCHVDVVPYLVLADGRARFPGLRGHCPRSRSDQSDRARNDPRASATRQGGPLQIAGPCREHRKPIRAEQLKRL
ncbi:nucleotidyltransferase [Streptomyces ureilyticus]|uniref:Nucleotidyltransferase n=1 Tax=Streptomyces ureilyticus TaxID=1775131 RepID=A0ABX0E212_9ACTN|nr:nucleotidyltransferase [Streptomyces ureilyticus]NGO46384.1 nucleotidyltransferase [Streptomyces ureilyticus]